MGGRGAKAGKGGGGGGGTTLFRSTNRPDTFRESTGGRAALTNGVYFGESAAAVKGYGAQTVQYQVTAKKFRTVRGDKEMDKIHAEATKWAKPQLDQHFSSVAAGKTKLNTDLVAGLTERASKARLYLESKGYQGLKYRKTTRDDHHDQVVVFRKKHVRIVGKVKD